MFDFSKALGGCEAINYQASSPFRTALVDFFQKWIDKTNTIKYEIDNEEIGNADYRRDKKVTEITNAWAKDGHKEFIAIIKKYTGMEVLNIRDFYDKNCMSFYYAYACEMVYGSQNDGNAVINLNRMAGTSDDSINYIPGSDKYKRWLDSADLNEYFDPASGKVSGTTWDKGKEKFTIRRIYFDVGHAFMHDMVMNEAAVKGFTAEELTAVMMHEIGHAMSGVEHFGNAYLRVMRAKQFEVTVAAIRKNNDTETAVALLNAVDRALPALKKSIDSSDLNPITAKTAEQLYNVTKGAIDAAKKASSQEDGLFVGLGKFFLITVLCVGLLFVALRKLISVFSINRLIDFAGEVSKRSGTTDIVSNKKTSDTSANASHIFTLERWADQYAERHGCGPDLITALEKLNREVKVQSSATSTFLYGLINSENSLNLTVLDFYMNILDFFTSDTSPLVTNYEVEYYRYIRICEDMRGFFKNCENCPPEIIKNWLMRIDAAEKNAAKTKKLKHNDIIKGAANILQNLTNPARWFTMLDDANLDRDLENFENNLSKLNNSNLFRLAAELKYR